MGLKRLLIAPVTALAALGAAAPSLAADFTVDVTSDFTFAPRSQKIAVGDTVTWTFSDGGHTATSRPGQAVSWNSGLEDSGQTFQKTFDKPGRFQYLCQPHRDFMTGEIVVGSDTVRDTVDAFKTKVRGSKVTVSFELNEAAAATYTLRGAAKRTVKRARLADGKQSITLKRLKAGSYRGTLVLSDDFDKRTTQRKSFTVR
jgi:plastocyanin